MKITIDGEFDVMIFNTGYTSRLCDDSMKEHLQSELNDIDSIIPVFIKDEIWGDGNYYLDKSWCEKNEAITNACEDGSIVFVATEGRLNFSLATIILGVLDECCYASLFSIMSISFEEINEKKILTLDIDSESG